MNETSLSWRQTLFNGKVNTLITVSLLASLVWFAWNFLPWAVFNAVFTADLEACRAARGSGACWGLIEEKWKLIVFGRYPFEEIWRPIVASIMMLAACLVMSQRQWWTPLILFSAAGVIALSVALMIGGFAGLSSIPTERLGGLALTLLLAIVGNILSLPLAVALALGRTSNLPFIRVVCSGFIELVRGVPLITVLFMASFMFPLFLPSGMNPDVLLRVTGGLILFSAAYQAEVIRGGINSVPRGQIEAAQALGMSYWLIQTKIVLPQAFRVVVPPLVNSFIAIFKDTSLVTIVSMFELFGSLRLALADPQWRPFFIEGFIFVALIYWVFCSAMSRYSRGLERDFAVARR
ncbi:MAG: amino acid ABC transporter permease [Betaproteobacteria bacterium]|jgi:general L-amino acid transport system permease protein|nr:amino acid ABC transporter permease [Betaproteobacteria bacterium]